MATLRGSGRVPHSDSCRQRLTEEIARGDEGDRVRRARQRELEFHEKVIRDKEAGSKRKNEEEGFDEKLTKRRCEEYNESIVMQDVERPGRGQKRAAEGPGHNSHHMVAAAGVVQMDLVDVSFAEYEEFGGMRMLACRGPEEEMR